MEGFPVDWEFIIDYNMDHENHLPEVESVITGVASFRSNLRSTQQRALLHCFHRNDGDSRLWLESVMRYPSSQNFLQIMGVNTYDNRNFLVIATEYSELTLHKWLMNNNPTYAAPYYQRYFGSISLLRRSNGEVHGKVDVYNIFIVDGKAKLGPMAGHQNLYDDITAFCDMIRPYAVDELEDVIRILSGVDAPTQQWLTLHKWLMNNNPTYASPYYQAILYRLEFIGFLKDILEALVYLEDQMERCTGKSIIYNIFIVDGKAKLGPMAGHQNLYNDITAFCDMIRPYVVDELEDVIRILSGVDAPTQQWLDLNIQEIIKHPLFHTHNDRNQCEGKYYDHFDSLDVLSQKTSV